MNNDVIIVSAETSEPRAQMPPHTNETGRKFGNLIFSSDGEGITGTFYDGEKSELIIQGRSLDNCFDALSKMVLMMQRRNGIVNFDQNGLPVPECTCDPKKIAAVMAAPEVGW